MEKKQSLFDSIAQGLGDAIEDIRHKVAEEPWFGRAVTEGREEAGQHWPEAVEPSFGSHTQIQDKEPERDVEQDLDR